MKNNHDYYKALSTNFLVNNLSLSGFNGHENALYQTLRELIENSIDAIYGRKNNDIDRLMIRIDIIRKTNYLEIICTDNGIGMKSKDIQSLCCDIFSTTKSHKIKSNNKKIINNSEANDSKNISSDNNHHHNPIQYGQYGIGLKSAIIYCQNHLSECTSCISITTSSNQLIDNNEGVYFMEFYINLKESKTILRKKMNVKIKDHSFCGTEIRIKFPLCTLLLPLINIFEYLNQIKYFVKKNMEINFLNEFNFLLSASKQQKYILHDFKTDDKALINYEKQYEYKNKEKQRKQQCLIKIYTIISKIDEAKNDKVTRKNQVQLPIQILRYANSIPLKNDESIHQCLVIKSFFRLKKKMQSFGWKLTANVSGKYPYLLTSNLKNYFQYRGYQMILLINIESHHISYANLSKSAICSMWIAPFLYNTYFKLIDILAQKYSKIFQTPKTYRQEVIIKEYLPLICESYSKILCRKLKMNKTHLYNAINISLTKLFFANKNIKCSDENDKESTETSLIPSIGF